MICYNGKTAEKWAHNSAVECHPHTVEVVGSNPTAPTNFTFTVISVPFSANQVTLPLATPVTRELAY